MSEMCLDCYNEIMETKEPSKMFLMSWKPDLCEHCGQYKRVIIRYRLKYIIKDQLCELIEDIKYLRRQKK